jgi:hypothetical protein
MDTKVCFKCGRNLPLSSFYKHPEMGDGHLNKCKECTKADVRGNYDKNILIPHWIEKLCVYVANLPNKGNPRLTNTYRRWRYETRRLDQGRG